MLHHLVKKAKRNYEPGFEMRRISWEVRVKSTGEVLDLVPLGSDTEGLLKRCPAMHNMNAGGRAHFLVETAKTIALFDNKTIKRHKFFWCLIRKASKSNSKLKPLIILYKKHLQKLKNELQNKQVRQEEWIKFRIDDYDPLTDENLLDWWRQWRKKDLDPSRSSVTKMLCLLTGELVEPVLTHNKIKGLSNVGGRGSGDVLIGYDKEAFRSYGLVKSMNGAVGEEAMATYSGELNSLLVESSRNFGNAKIVYWFDKTVPSEYDLFKILDIPVDENQSEQDEKVAKLKVEKLLKSIYNGERVDLRNNRYYALALSGNSGRVMVRDWMEGSFEELAENIKTWFDDLEIVDYKTGNLSADPKFMEVAGSVVRERKELHSSILQPLLNAAIKKQRIPNSILVKALEQFKKDVIEKKIIQTRMGLMKAYFIRKGEEMSAYVNPNHPDAAYHCGRLLAVLAQLQQSALGDVGAGVVQRYYVAASLAPALTFGRLLSNAKNHLNKLDGGLARWYEDRIAQIMGQIGDVMPRVLDLERQSLFALGYYQQLAADRNQKNKS